jgi:hypothetical protein
MAPGPAPERRPPPDGGPGNAGAVAGGTQHKGYGEPQMGCFADGYTRPGQDDRRGRSSRPGHAGQAVVLRFFEHI